MIRTSFPVSVKLMPGRMCILTGPNGSGKTTLARKVAREQKGVFLGFQEPVTVPGVNYLGLLRLASRTRLGPLEFYEFLKDKAKVLEIPESFLNRNLNEGFSGGEKKKMELFQALVLEPEYAIFDETDSGVDTHNQKLLLKGARLLLGKGTGILWITHNTKLFKPLQAFKYYKMENGRVVS